MTPFTIQPDVARAATIHKRFYLDEDVWRLALERIFARSWQWIGDLRDVAAPLALSPREVLPGSLDEPLLLVRDAAGTLRGLSNVCTHRGKVIVEAPGRAEPQGLRCGYHGRRYDFAGRAWFMPGFDGVADFPCEADHLGRGAGGALDPVEMEDEAAVLSVQRGIRSRFYAGGRYSPQHERGVHQFHNLLAAALNSETNRRG